MRHRLTLTILCFASASGLILLLPVAESAPPASAELEQQFTQTVRPFVMKYCVACHSGSAPAAQFDLRSYATMESVVEDHQRWATVIDKLSAKQMPPPQLPQPPEEVRQQVIEWIRNVRSNEARKNAGDPGPVLARRLSNAEYNYTIRDLTGVDMQPTREFPVDPANTAGFDNSGESLTHVARAAEEVSAGGARSGRSHGAEAGRHSTSRRIRCWWRPTARSTPFRRIVNFYERQPTDYADYFEAAWRFKHRAALGKPVQRSPAAKMQVSPKYLPLIWEILERGETTRSWPDREAAGDVARSACRRRQERSLRANSASRCAISSCASGAIRRCSSPLR